jgi:hypothetical protein
MLQEPSANVHPKHVQRAPGCHPQSRRHGHCRDGHVGKGTPTQHNLISLLEFGTGQPYIYISF